MSRLRELIERYCPDGVEYKALGDIGDFYGGLTGKSKKDFGEGAKFVTYNNVYGNPAINLDDYGLVRIDPGENQNTVELGDVIFTISSENREEAGMTSVMTEETGEPWYLNSFCTGWRLRDKSLMLPDFLKHMLRGPEAREAISRTANGVTRFNISKPRLAKVRVPVPPIEVQREVVRILDEYTAAHDELVRLLEHHSQYVTKARDEWLQAIYDDAFGHCSRERLGKYCALINGDRGKNYPSRGSFVDDGVAFINAGHIQNGALDFSEMNYITEENYNVLRSGKVQPGDILYCLRGSLGKHCLLDDVRGAIASSLVIIRCDGEHYLPEFVNYTLDMPFITDQMNAVSNGSAQPNLAGKSVAAYQIPLPTLEEQRSFLSRLDKGVVESFSDLVTELNLQVRLLNEQLVFVRNQLLSFPEKVA